ncbi:MAG: trypsin-like peptidase domain-containing protein [Candidatus Poribacteria bacterium]|nr:trypsin-like peptidase domain-containing protein [Candidatus Poribacteria bacterium]
MTKRKKKNNFNNKILTHTVRILPKKISVFCKYTRIAVLLFGVILSLFILSFQADVHAEQDLQHAITQSRRTAIVTAVEHASPAVVNISATRNVTRPTLFDEFYERFYGFEPPIRKHTLREVGSGVIISKDGYILTNHHVIEDAEKIRVAIADGREFDAHILGFDFFSDLALLKVNTKEDLPEIKWGDSGDLLIGEWALAIGNPFGLSIGNAQPTVTVGIVSATQRSLAVDNRFYEALIQTDASVNPGNSGGALVNVHGELIGINTVIRSTSGGSQGVGFAIPANKARKVIEKITEHGCIVPPYLGVEIQSITGEMAEKILGKEVSQKSIFSRGVLVSELEKQSPIAAAGIKRGDIISVVSGRRIKDENDFKAIVRLLPLNQNIQCEFIRRGKKREANFKLKTLEWEYAPQRWGLTLTQPDKKRAKKYKHRGVVISHIERGNELAEVLKKGDNIYRIDEIEIHTLEIFKIVDKQIHAPSKIPLYFERNGEQKSILITFERNNRWR